VALAGHCDDSGGVISRMTTIDEIQLIRFPIFTEPSAQGILRVFEALSMPFGVQRIFSVHANAGGLRGQHAHRKCTQLLVCVSGQVSVFCDDAEHTAHFTLHPQSDALLLPAGIWSTQCYEIDSSSLVVFCDYPYDEADYIRDFEVFSKWKTNK